MDQEFSIQSIWLILILWSFIYLADYYLTIVNARRHKECLHIYFRFEGSLEITPQFQKDVDELRLFSPRFVIRLLTSMVFLIILWLFSVKLLEQPHFFYLIFGAFILLEAAAHIRNIRNIALYPIAKSGGLKGRIEYARWSSITLSAVELISFSLLYLLLTILLKSWFLLGGALGCMVAGIQHWNMSKKAFAMSQMLQDKTTNA